MPSISNERPGQYQDARSADELRLDHEFFMRELGTIINTMRKQANVSDHEIVSKQFREVRRSVVEIQISQHSLVVDSVS